jgi:hypothetical protein
MYGKKVSMIEKNLTPEQLQKIVKQKHLTLNAGIDRVIDKEKKWFGSHMSVSALQRLIL